MWTTLNKYDTNRYLDDRQKRGEMKGKWKMKMENLDKEAKKDQ